MRQVPMHPIRIALLTSLGSALEYYAFICFALQAPVISALFFQHLPLKLALVETLTLFAVGSVMTLLGGYIFGHVADRYGRKNILLLAIMLMTIATVAMGLLPTYLGLFGALLLLLLRLIQGFSQGAELPGAITFICEHADVPRRGFSTGLLFLGVGLGAALASLVNFLIWHYLSRAEVMAYAWRIPFLLAFLLGCAGFYLRRQAQETPLFLAQVKLKAKIKLPGRKLIQAAALVWLPAVMVSLGLFWPAFLERLHYQQNDIFLAMTFAFVTTACLLPLFGLLSDIVGRKKLYGIGLALLLMSAYPMLMHLADVDRFYLYLFSFWYYLMIVILAANYPVMLAELFPTMMRYQAVAISYAGSYALAGGVPMLVGALALKFAILPVLIVVLYASAVLSLLGLLVYQEREGVLISE